MKEEALKLADDLLHSEVMVLELEASRMIRRLVEELDYLKDQIRFYEIKDLDSGIIGKIGDCQIHDLVHRTKPQTKPLSDEEIDYYTKSYFNIHPEAHLFEQFKIKLYELQEFARAIEERHGIK